jgi:asparagine synthase (glutamine-hydrolysing)
MMDRPKLGFAIPIADWLQKDLKDLVLTYINEKRITEQGIFNWPQVKGILDSFYNGKKELDYKLWYLLMFQMWHARWMEKS